MLDVRLRTLLGALVLLFFVLGLLLVMAPAGGPSVTKLEIESSDDSVQFAGGSGVVPPSVKMLMVESQYVASAFASAAQNAAEQLSSDSDTISSTAACGALSVCHTCPQSSILTASTADEIICRLEEPDDTSEENRGGVCHVLDTKSVASTSDFSSSLSRWCVLPKVCKEPSLNHEDFVELAFATTPPEPASSARRIQCGYNMSAVPQRIGELMLTSSWWEHPQFSKPLVPSVAAATLNWTSSAHLDRDQEDFPLTTFSFSTTEQLKVEWEISAAWIRITHSWDRDATSTPLKTVLTIPILDTTDGEGSRRSSTIAIDDLNESSTYFGSSFAVVLAFSLILGVLLYISAIPLMNMITKSDIPTSIQASRATREVDSLQEYELGYFENELDALLDCYTPRELSENVESSHREHSYLPSASQSVAQTRNDPLDPSTGDDLGSTTFASTTEQQVDFAATGSVSDGPQSRGASANMPHRMPNPDDDDDDNTSALSSVTGGPPLQTATTVIDGFTPTHGSVAFIFMHRFHSLVLSDLMEAERISGDFLSEVHSAAKVTDGHVANFTACSAVVVWNCIVPRIAHESFAAQFAEIMNPKLGQFHHCFLSIVTGKLNTSKNIKPPLVVGHGIDLARSLSTYQRECGCRVALSENIVFKAFSNDLWKVRPLDVLSFKTDEFNEFPLPVHELLHPMAAAQNKTANSADFPRLQGFFAALQKMHTYQGLQLIHTVANQQRSRRWNEICQYFQSGEGAKKLKERGKYFRKEIGWNVPWIDQALARRKRTQSQDAEDILVDEAEHEADDEEEDASSTKEEKTDYDHLPIRFGKGFTRSDKRLATQKHANVFLGMNTDGTPVAITCIAIDTCPEDVLASKMNSFVMATKVHHRHSAALMSINRINNKYLMAVSEYVSGGELKTHINEFRTLRIQCVKRYAKELLEVLKYLHKHGIVHRLVAPSNILLTMDGTCKLVNYRCAINIVQQPPLQDATGTPISPNPSWIPFDPDGIPAQFQPPEVRTGVSHKCSDVYSFGKVVAAMLGGSGVWVGDEELHNLLLNNVQLKKPEFAEVLSHAHDIVMSCCKMNPNERATVDELGFHPFFM